MDIMLILNAYNEAEDKDLFMLQIADRMDNETRESLHGMKHLETDFDFLKEYDRYHLLKFGEKWKVC